MNFKYYNTNNLWTSGRFLENIDDQRRFQTVSSIIPKNTDSILDVGAGNGAFFYYLEENILDHPSLLGVEPATSAIKQKMCEANILNGNATNLKFPDRSFDLVMALEVIEHLTFNEYEIALKEIERVAKKYIILSVPYKDKRPKVECLYCGCKFNPSYHMRSFSEENLFALFEFFRMKTTSFINVDKVIGPKHVINFFNNIFDLPRNMSTSELTICPQCGFSFTDSKELEKTKRGKREIDKGLEKIKKYMPRISKKNWIIVLYERIL